VELRAFESGLIVPGPDDHADIGEPARRVHTVSGMYDQAARAATSL